MGFMDWLPGRAKQETRASPENPTVPVTAENFLEFFGVNGANLPVVNFDTAMQVPAFAAAVGFLSSSMANLPAHVYRPKGDSAERVGGKIQRLLNESPNPQWTSYGMRKYLWQGVFGQPGRGCAWIERNGNTIEAIWPFEHNRVQVSFRAGRKWYHSEGRDYPAEDVIDLTFMLKQDMISVYSPLYLASKAVQLALAMGDYGANFFAGGGVPPLALTGPMPSGPEAVKRAKDDIKRAIDGAKGAGEHVFPIPAGYELKQVGFDPAKGQMTEARRFQIEEIARVYSLPPVFLQDLTHGTFSNTEQQDLHFVKHLVAQWAKMAEEEFNLKLFGASRSNRYMEHQLDSLQRGDFTSRMTGYAQGIQNAVLTPDEARALENRPSKGGAANDLHIQGATVPLGSQPNAAEPPKKDDGAPAT